jgi:hypothetical protein
MKRLLVRHSPPISANWTARRWPTSWTRRRAAGARMPAIVIPIKAAVRPRAQAQPVVRKRT